MTDYVDINEVNFELKKSKYADECIKKHMQQPIKTLYDCYAKPSDKKKEAYESIITLFGNDDKITHISVTSFNRYMFTVQAILLDDDYKPFGLMVITPEHNNLYIQA